MQVTIGGDRVGSGRKMKANLHNYFRSTHNLSERFASSMGSGILYPCLCKLAMRGDSFDIDIAADCRTIPTQGPLFGSYKMQVDIYQVPIRLYQGILHNNPLKVGLNMSQVNFPVLRIGTEMDNKKGYGKMNDSSLLKYLGLSGIGISNQEGMNYRARDINAIPALSYYDIFKNYYANKQEEKAYVISALTKSETIGFHDSFRYRDKNGTWNDQYFDIHDEFNIGVQSFAINQNVVFEYKFDSILTLAEFYRNTIIEVETRNGQQVQSANISVNNDNTTISGSSWEKVILNGIRVKVMYEDTGEKNENGAAIYKYQVLIINQTGSTISTIGFLTSRLKKQINSYNPLSIVPFDLTNIDDMRYDLLSHNRLGDTFVIKDNEGQENDSYLPYKVLVAKDSNRHTLNNYPMNGLVLKTYQNDIFNNWLNSEQIEGEGSITELTQVSVTEGKFSMDALSFAEKLYNMLNRIAIAGNTYEDWQDVVYEEAKRRQIESPIFLGGMSQEVMFDEIVQNAPTKIDGIESPLGTLGGRGRLIHESKKGGKIHVKVDEASFIIGIVSLTPRVFYSQGNEFYMTDIKTMDDLHKPAMDGIGFQDLIGERMAWWDTHIAENTVGHSTGTLTRSKIGKLPAWIEYMTSVDKCYGDFAGEYGDKAGFMVLNRNYEFDESTGGIKDATTYVDPSKYNYAFADKTLQSQNFWVEIAFDIKARRLMSAKLIPSV